MIASPDLTGLGGWAALLIGMTLSFIYSGMETGNYVVNKIRLELRAEAGQRRAVRLHGLLAKPDTPLIVVLIGNNLANYLASAGMFLIVQSEAYAALILTPLVFVFCELLPKNLFHRHGESLAYVFGGFLSLSRRLFAATGLVVLIRGIVWLVTRLFGHGPTGVSGALGGGRWQMAILLAEGRASGALTHAQSLIAERVVNIGQVGLRDVMVPLEKAAMVSELATKEQLHRLLADGCPSRLGVFRDDRDNIVGVLNVYEALLDESGAEPSSHVGPAVRLPESLSVTEALVRLQHQRAVVGIVCSEKDRAVGLLGVRDLVEEIVGELAE
jgi:putative hemolysin